MDASRHPKNKHWQSVATVQLANKKLFDELPERQKLYAHHLAKAAWHGARISLRQISEEGPGIYNLIMELHKSCQGDWGSFIEQGRADRDELDAFLEFAGQFLSSLGNYYKQDRKVAPPISIEGLHKLADISPKAREALIQVLEPMISVPPCSLGFPDEKHASNYYPGETRITKEEVAWVSEIMKQHSLEPENTRVRKTIRGSENPCFHVLQGSADTSEAPIQLDDRNSGSSVYLDRGDHAAELAKICVELEEAAKYVTNEKQSTILGHYLESFHTGSLAAYRESQKVWVTDMSPPVEISFGFIEPYRDPAGLRGEWQGVVSIADPAESSKLKDLVANADKFIRTCPWAKEGENHGKGPFEASRFQDPDFAIVHSVAYVASTIFEAQNLPNYNDIRQNEGSKNTVWASRMNANENPHRPCPYVHPSEFKSYRGCNHVVRFLVTSLHELLGHGTGKLLAETSPGEYNFDKENPPISPLTGQSIKSWYMPGQTWTSVFGELAATLDECRAMLVSYYLAENKEILSILVMMIKLPFVYYTYLHVGVEGILALSAYNADDKAWSTPHAWANYTILRHLLTDANGFMTIDHDPEAETLHVRIDRNRILQDGKPSLGRMLLHLHIYRCTADFDSCKEYYELLSGVEGQYEEWRKIVVANPEPMWKFVQGNTILGENGEVGFKIYEASNEGIIQSFADREV
ncbi:hypothetical protein PG991_009457 [Apiospora marii]|uniref:Dipeptidyl peptidase III n=1 Tax=Apiospora marii TaxID=335849 RepID=A0ABR1RIU4_9PEZI